METKLCVTPPNVETVIYKQLRDGLSDHSRVYRLLEVDWPDAIDTVKRLCTYLSDAIRVDDDKQVPVLNVVVKKALDDYYTSLKEGETDHLRYATFIRSLVHALSTTLENITVTNAVDQSSWRPDDGEAFVEWASKTEDHELSLLSANVSRERVDEALRECLLMSYQLNVVYKTEYEGLEDKF